ncbi:sulfatase-like hydrolase/transferase [Protaetiibacter mangrovi]|uniref:Sulfatase-like hydrolase/transferase n=1 Tax=Protaetiibacter mangrovi TaxID=2970926 RepID=A0ABT1ZH98_9MICO|nr:sulfatase-like hydrolase/transferase [Protaetiibacter mangrovi]MCS0500088.1 sulfatase-like hydrolase/transferase [Protaetiibacter mangrovi]TPX04506.1 sulfatase-like hydrolase/transferase [Schumannella luteola]
MVDADATTPGPRNIVFLFTDQHRRDTLGCYGNDVVATPALDALAARGMRFDRWHTPTAICTPARVSVLTGQAPFRHGVLANHERNVAYVEDLPDDVFVFSRALREHGYNCGLVGKWHAGYHLTAADYGFDSVDLPGWHNPVDHPDYLAYLRERGLPEYEITEPIRGTLPNGRAGNLLAARLRQPIEATFERYLTDRAIEHLERYGGEWKESARPFFLSLNFFGPHLPYLVPDEYYDMYDPDAIELPESVAETFADKPAVQRNYSAHWGFDTLTPEESRKLIAVYWGYVSLIDAEIGRLNEALERLGLSDSTAILFSSDHGEFTGAHRLHDKGPAMYDDIYRTAGIVAVPGCPPGQSDELVSLLDTTATILELAGLDPAPAVDSRSLLPLVRGEDVEWDDQIICEFHGHHFPYPQRMIRRGDVKLVVNPESRNELYDLATDPFELHNRYEHPEFAHVRRDLIGRLYRALRDRGDNFFHWMTSMYEIGDLDYDPTLSAFELGAAGDYQQTAPDSER